MRLIMAVQLSEKEARNLKRAKELNVLVSTKDQHLLKKHMFCIDHYGYPVTNVKLGKNQWRVTKLHHLIYPRKEKFVMDHINRIKTDNRRVNLRYCTQQENSWNKTRKVTNKSGCSGVWWDPKRMNWEVSINYKMKKIHLGRFKDKDMAVSVRREKEKELYR